MTALYNSPHQFEPLVPSDLKQEPLLSKAGDLVRAATALGGKQVPAQLHVLLRSMNSYYTNRIEGQHTRPHEIEQALRKDFSANKELAAKQRLAVAHIEAEASLEQRYGGEAAVATLYSQQAVQDVHHELFGRLPPQDWEVNQGQTVVPGQLRDKEVSVGQHIAPAAAHVSEFLARWSQRYGRVRRGEAALVAMACAHHRLGWIHPFPDGNGRVMRLHTHLVLHALGLTNGLWSPLRGFARSQERYYLLLAEADNTRRGDLDGRGNLSEKALVAWADYVLDICLDQVQFMQQMLDFDAIKQRIEAALLVDASVHKSGVRPESLRAMHYLFLSGEALTRGEFKSMLGLSERVATDALSALLKRGFLSSDSPQGKVQFGLPQHALRFLFPKLWPEAEADAA